MVTTSGFAKAGNHALVKAVQLLGQPCEVTHVAYVGPIGQHVFIKRDPRNIVCSWLRFNGQPVTQGMFLTAFRKFQYASLVDEMAAFEGWLTDPQTLVVSYESLVASDVEMRRIAEYLGVPYLDDAFSELEGLTATWFAEHSDYRTLWSPEVEAAWAAEGGNDLLNRWGYAWKL